MDKEVEKYYEAYREMFVSEGWKQLIKELQDDGETIDTITTVSDVEELWYRRGQLNVISRMINMEGALEAAFSELQMQEQF